MGHGASTNSKSHYEIHASELLEKKDKQRIYKSAHELQIDGKLALNTGAGSPLYQEPNPFKSPSFSPSSQTSSSKKEKKETSDLELQAQAHWHKILMHARNRDAEREKAQARKLKKKSDGEEEDDIFEFDPNIDKEMMNEELLEEGHEDAGKATSPLKFKKHGNSRTKMSFDEDEVNAGDGKKKKKTKKKPPEEEKKKFNPFDFIRGKLKKKLDDDIDDEEKGLMREFGDEGEGDEDCEEDGKNPNFSCSDDDTDEENDYEIYKGELKLPPVQITLKSRTQDSVTLNWDIDPTAMEALYEIQESLGYHFRPKYEIAYQLSEGINSSPLSNWTIATSDVRSHGGRIKSLDAHTAYVFRAKRVGWDDDYGEPVVIRTGPGPPGAPSELKMKEVTSDSILVTWAYPEKDNGLPVTEYIVSMKAWGKEFDVMYSGKNKLYLATGLTSGVIYIFEVKAKNKAGESVNASSRVSVRTLPAGSQSMTPWVEFIDEKTEKVCYQHPATGALAWELPKGGFIDEQESFRFKRMWLTSRMYRKSFVALQELGKESHVNQLQIDRAKMLEQSLQKFYAISPIDLDAGPIKIVFENEEGIDAGGLGKDWFSQVAKLITSSSSGIFCILPGGDVTIDPRAGAIMSSYELKWIFKAVGAFMAKAIIDGHTLGLFLNPLLLIYLVGDTPSYDDLEKIEPSYFNGLEYIKQHDVSELDLNFTATYELFDEPQVVELKPNGRNEPVSQTNKGHYCQLMCDWLVRKRFEPGLSYLLEGFHRNMLVKDISKFKPSELQSILGGCQTVDPADIIENARFAGGFDVNSDHVIWLFSVIEELDQMSLSKFLSFVTGCRSLPLDGLKPTLLITMWGEDETTDKTLPKAHTCFNQLVLPAYSSLEVLKERLDYALSNSSDGFFMS